VGVERLKAGQAFHRAVQSAFLTGLAGASGFRERQWGLIRGGRGRVDLAVEVDGDEQMLVIIEIKGTGWDAIPADRVMRNLRRHLRQLQAYLDTAIEDMEAGQWEGVVGGLAAVTSAAAVVSGVSGRSGRGRILRGHGQRSCGRGRRAEGPGRTWLQARICRAMSSRRRPGARCRPR